MTREAALKTVNMAYVGCEREHFHWKLINKIYDEFETTICGNCIHVDMPHSREPAEPCCTVIYDKNGFWKTVDIKKDFCSNFKGK